MTDGRGALLVVATSLYVMKTRFITVAAVLLQPQLSAASLCRTPLECGQTALCGNEGAAPLAREDTANICAGFHSANDGSGARRERRLCFR